MFKDFSRRLVLGLGLLVLPVLASTLSQVSAQQQPATGSCRTAADRARFVEVRARIDALKKQVGVKRPVPPAVQKEIAALQKELASIMARRPCSMGASPVKGPGTPPPVKDEEGMRVEDCAIINCDCANINAGLLSGPWRRECTQTEAAMKEMCAKWHYIDRMCHDTASGPAAFPKAK